MSSLQQPSRSGRRPGAAVGQERPPNVAKSTPCPYFLNNNCRHGDRCRFRHETAEAPLSPFLATSPVLTEETSDVASEQHDEDLNDDSAQGPASRTDRRRKAPCWDYLADMCQRGDNCKYNHNITIRTARDRAEVQNRKEAHARRLEAMRAEEERREERRVEAERRRAVQAAVRKETRARQKQEAQARRAAAEQRRIAEERRLEAEIQRAQEEEEERLLEAERQRVREQERIREEERQREAEVQRLREQQEAEARQAEAAAQRRIEQERLRQEEQARRALEDERRRQARNREEAGVTLRHLVLGTTIVTFRAGVDIANIVTGFESCRVLVRNLPANARPTEVTELFTSQGITKAQFYLVGNLRRTGQKQEATIVVDAEMGEAVALGLNGVDFREEKLSFDVAASGSVQGMGTIKRETFSFVISWKMPQMRVVVVYHSPDEAEARIRQLNGQRLGDRTVHVQVNRLPPPNSALQPNAIAISDVNPAVSDVDIRGFIGDHCSFKRLKALAYNQEIAERNLRADILRIAAGGNPVLEMLAPAAGFHKLRASFTEWNVAERVHKYLSAPTLPSIGTPLRVSFLTQPLRHTITIPLKQYGAQRRRWNALRIANASNISIQELDQRVLVHVSGSDEKALGALKVRVERLAAGETVPAWHSSLRFRSGANTFLDTVYSHTGAYVRYDWRIKVLRVYGDDDSIQEAREMVRAEVERLSSQEVSLLLKRPSVRYFVQRGVQALKEVYGEDNVTLELSSSRITVRSGGDEALHAIHRHIAESLQRLSVPTNNGTDAICPVCYDSVSTPVLLACGHSYCDACLRHFFTTAADAKQFPLTCMGNDATCGVSFPIPVIQRFLPERQFDDLLEAAFVHHIESNPQLYKYCTTPDCQQIYRVDHEAAKSVHCPSCFASICNSCSEDHDGMTCAEYKERIDPNEAQRLTDEWARQNGVQKCPHCSVLIEKIAGCNHMTCKCGAHVCYVCGRQFAADSIYEHMNQAHGGFYAEVRPQLREAPVPAAAAPDDYRAQAEALERYRRVAEERRAAAARQAPANAGRNADLYNNHWYEQRRAEAERYREAQERARELEAARQREQERQQRERESGGWCVVM